MSAERLSLNGFLKYLLAATGDPQLVFASYADGATARETQNLRDDLAERGIELQHLEQPVPPTVAEVKAQREQREADAAAEKAGAAGTIKPTPKAYSRVPDPAELAQGQPEKK